MINFILKKQDLIFRNISTDIKVFENKDEKIIQQCIDQFNSEIKWNDMFDLKQALVRIKKGDKLFVGYYKNELFGYCWLEKISNIYCIYNVFSKKEPNVRNYGATDLLYIVIQNYVTNTNDSIIAYVDEWNIKSINMFKKLGFIEK